MARHPVTGMEIEDGHGALPHDVQVINHLAYIEQTRGHEVADAMRKEIGLPTSAEQAAEAALKADKEIGLHEKLADHHDRLTELEQNAAEHEAMKERISALERKVDAMKADDHGD